MFCRPARFASCSWNCLNVYEEMEDMEYWRLGSGTPPFWTGVLLC